MTDLFEFYVFGSTLLFHFLSLIWPRRYGWDIMFKLVFCVMALVGSFLSAVRLLQIFGIL